MISEYVVLCLLSAVAGGINAVAGGGTLLTFPALVAVLTHRGMSNETAKVFANGTSTVALFPASVAALWGYRKDFASVRGWARFLFIPSIVGGVLGATLVTQLPDRIFAFCVPWLILLAASLFTLQPFIAKRMGIGEPHQLPNRSTIVGVMFFQLLVGIYGGYFGAGIGVLMLGALAMMGLSDIHAMNGLKSMLASGINGCAVLIFVLSQKVDWPLASAMAVSGCMGGYLAARVARRLPRSFIRGLVIAIGFSLATYYFVRG